MSEPNALSQAKAILAPVNKDGYKFVAIGAGATLLGFYLWSPLGWICLAVTLALAFFFRDPYRVVPQRDGLIVAPADGVVICIEPVKPPVELNLGEEPRTRVSIFLSVLDVHVARAPLAGPHRHVRRIGRAFTRTPRPPTRRRKMNATALAIEAKEGVRLGVVLVAGYVARRIVTEVKIGDTVGAGRAHRPHPVRQPRRHLSAAGGRARLRRPADAGWRDDRRRHAVAGARSHLQAHLGPGTAR